jgi:hypothetical protein
LTATRVRLSWIVGEAAVGVQHLGRVTPLACVEAGVGEGDPGLLREDSEHELLGA